jgi:hypothetical protein
MEAVRIQAFALCAEIHNDILLIIYKFSQVVIRASYNRQCGIVCNVSPSFQSSLKGVIPLREEEHNLEYFCPMICD